MASDLDTFPPSPGSYKPKKPLPRSPAVRGALPPQTEAPTEFGIGEPLSAPTSLGPDPHPERAPARAEWVTFRADNGDSVRYHSVRDSALIAQLDGVPGVVEVRRQPAAMLTERGARQAGYPDSTAAAGFETLTPEQRRGHAMGAALPMLASIPAQFIPGAGPLAKVAPFLRVGGGMASAAAVTPISAAMQERPMGKNEMGLNAVLAGVFPALVEGGMALARPIGRWMTNASFRDVPESVRLEHVAAMNRERPAGAPKLAAHEARLGDFALENDMPMPGPDFSGPNRGVAGSTQVDAQIQRALARRNRILQRLGVRPISADWAGDPNMGRFGPGYVGDNLLNLLDRVAGHERGSVAKYDNQILQVLRNAKLANWVKPVLDANGRVARPGYWEMIPKTPQELQSLITEWDGIASALHKSGANYRTAPMERSVYKALANDAREWLRAQTPSTRPGIAGRLQVANQEASRRIPYRTALEHIEGRNVAAEAPVSAPAAGVITGVAAKNPATAGAGLLATTAARATGSPRVASRIGRELYNANTSRGGRLTRLLASTLSNTAAGALMGAGEYGKRERSKPVAAPSKPR